MKLINVVLIGAIILIVIGTSFIVFSISSGLTHTTKYNQNIQSPINQDIPQTPINHSSPDKIECYGNTCRLHYNNSEASK